MEAFCCCHKHASLETCKGNVKCTVVQALGICTGRTAHRGSRGIGKGKVHRCTALRLCTGRTAHRGSRGIGKAKVHRCTGTEALYRPYGP